IAGGEPVLLHDAGAIRDQAAGGDEVAFEVDRGQLVLGGQADQDMAMKSRQPASGHYHTAIAGARESRDRTFDLAGVAYIHWSRLDAERRRRGLDGAELAGTQG